MDGADDARTIGRRIRQVRGFRRKPLRVIAGLAGMSASTLHRIEYGEHPLTLAELVALANALKVAPSELTKLPIPAPGNGHTDSTIEAVRLALDAVENDSPDGDVLPVSVLREQVSRIHRQRRSCRFAEVAADLPGLIRNVHAALATGTEHADLLDLAVYLHVHVTRLWLVHAGAPTDLVRRVVFLTQRLAQERDETTTLAVAGFGVVDTLLFDGAFEHGVTKLNSIALPSTTAETAHLVAVLTAERATVATLEGRPGDVAAPLDAAAELAERFDFSGESYSLGFVLGPAMVDALRMWHALEADEPDRAVGMAQGAQPLRDPFPVNQVYFWVCYGRALARLRGRLDDAVWALRTAEDIFPTKVRRDPIVREVVSTLLPGAGRNATGVELRGLAHRVGLPT